MAGTTEQKTYLINFQDNLDAYAQHAADAKKEVDRLTKANKDLAVTEGVTQKEIEESNAALRTAQNEYKNATKAVDLATKARKAESGSYEQLLRQHQLAQTQLKLLNNTIITNADGTRTLSKTYIDQSKKVDNAKKALDAFGKGIHDNRLNVGNYSEVLKGLGNGLNVLPGSFGSAVGGAKALGKQLLVLMANPIVALIAAIAAALIGLFKAFMSTDTGADLMAEKMEQLRAIFDVVRQRAIALIGVLVSLFKGDFKGAADQFNAAISGVGDQMIEAARAAKEYAAAIDAVKESEANYISQSAETENAIAKLEFTAADASKSITERRKAIKEAIRLSELESQTRMELAKQTLDAELKYLGDKNNASADEVLALVRMTDAERENASDSMKLLLDNNRAKVDEIEKLYAAWINADTKFYAENKRNIGKAAAFEEAARKEQSERRETERIAQLRRETDIAITEMRTRLAGVGMERLNAEVSTQQKIDDVSKLAEKRRIERLSIETEAAYTVMEQSLMGQLELESIMLQQSYEQRIAAANAVNADTTDIEKQYSNARKAIAKAEADAKISLAMGVANDIIKAVGEQSALGKAAAVAQTLITTYQSATGAFASFTAPPVAGAASVPLGLVAAAAAVAAGLANVKKILSVKLPKGSGGGGSASAAGGGAVTSAASRVTATPLAATTLQPVQSAADIAKQQQQSTLTADAIATAVGKMPPPVVTVEDINAKTKDVKQVEIRATV